MEHVAIDLGSRKSQICVRSSDGTVIKERRCTTPSRCELGRQVGGRVEVHLVRRLALEGCRAQARASDGHTPDSCGVLGRERTSSRENHPARVSLQKTE